MKEIHTLGKEIKFENNFKVTPFFFFFLGQSRGLV